MTTAAGQKGHEVVADGITPPHTAIVGPPPRSRARQSTVIALLVALGLVAGAWYVGGRQDFSAIGKGGTNLRLLPGIGEPAPDFVAWTVTGDRVQLSSLRGQPVWINFWGSWCPPCRAEFPEMQAAYTDVLQPSGVIVLAVGLDEPPELSASFAVRNGGTFTILSDPVRADTSSGYPIANFPTHILVDRDGIVRDIILAPIDQPEIERRAQQIIATAATQSEGQARDA